MVPRIRVLIAVQMVQRKPCTVFYFVSLIYFLRLAGGLFSQQLKRVLRYSTSWQLHGMVASCGHCILRVAAVAWVALICEHAPHNIVLG